MNENCEFLHAVENYAKNHYGVYSEASLLTLHSLSHFLAGLSVSLPALPSPFRPFPSLTFSFQPSSSYHSLPLCTCTLPFPFLPVFASPPFRFYPLTLFTSLFHFPFQSFLLILFFLFLSIFFPSLIFLLSPFLRFFSYFPSPFYLFSLYSVLSLTLNVKKKSKEKSSESSGV